MALRSPIVLFALLLACAYACAATPPTASAQRPTDSAAARTTLARGAGPDARATELLTRLTREQRFWQLFMIPGDLDSAAFDYSQGIFGLQGIIATPEHFVANVGAGGRDWYPIVVSRRALEERYFPPFRSLILDAGARSVMTAYNSVDGSPATQRAMLMNGVLKREWGLCGFIISDTAATSGATVLFAAS